MQRSIHLQAVAHRLFAVLTAIAAALILGQAFARQAASDTGDAAGRLAEQLGPAAGPEPPKSIADFGRVDAMPAVLAGLLTALAVATLAHTTLSLVRRRRRELAILKTLGFVRAQIQATVASQTTALMLVALAVGLQLGLVCSMGLAPVRGQPRHRP